MCFRATINGMALPAKTRLDSGARSTHPFSALWLPETRPRISPQSLLQQSSVRDKTRQDKTRLMKLTSLP